ncbi:MAG: hypothetical protein WCF67_01670 [Chitinophagaceae bacterium]
MNTRIITSAVAACFLLVVMTSCSTTRTYPDNRPYPGDPYPTGRYPAPDGRYPDSRYPDGRYPDGRSYPTSRYPGKLPPGQAKKVYGQKSAKVFAPGQQNKNWKQDKHHDYKKKKYSKNKKYRN